MVFWVSTSATWQLPIPPRAAIRLAVAIDELLERCMAGRESGPGDRTGSDHSGLELGDLGKGGLDAFFHSANLGGEFVGDILDHLFAHGAPFPGA